MHHHGISSNVSILQTSELNALLHAIDTEWEKLDIALAEGDAEHAETLLTEIRRLTRQADAIRMRSQLLCRAGSRNAA